MKSFIRKHAPLIFAPLGVLWFVGVPSFLVIIVGPILRPHLGDAILPIGFAFALLTVAVPCIVSPPIETWLKNGNVNNGSA